MFNVVPNTDECCCFASTSKAKLIQLAERTILVMTSQKGIQVSTTVAH